MQLWPENRPVGRCHPAGSRRSIDDMSLVDQVNVLRDSTAHAMNDVAYLTIADDHVECVTQTVLGLYAVQAAALGASASAVVDGSEDVAGLQHARQELRALDDAHADLGCWHAAGATAELVGAPAVLREVMRAALSHSANAVVEMVARYEAGREELPAVRRAVETVPALFALFESFESADSS
jgi:hypothetical protein